MASSRTVLMQIVLLLLEVEFQTIIAEPNCSHKCREKITQVRPQTIRLFCICACDSISVSIHEKKSKQ
jgi:hypothetical protein